MFFKVSCNYGKQALYGTQVQVYAQSSNKMELKRAGLGRQHTVLELSGRAPLLHVRRAVTLLPSAISMSICQSKHTIARCEIRSPGASIASSLTIKAFDTLEHIFYLLEWNRASWVQHWVDLHTCCQACGPNNCCRDEASSLGRFYFELLCLHTTAFKKEVSLWAASTSGDQSINPHSPTSHMRYVFFERTGRRRVLLLHKQIIMTGINTNLAPAYVSLNTFEHV